MPPDTLITVAQKTEEKGAKEAKETEQDSKVNAGTVALLVIERMNVVNLVEEQAKAKAKAGGKAPRWLCQRQFVEKL